VLQRLRKGNVTSNVSTTHKAVLENRQTHISWFMNKLWRNDNCASLLNMQHITRIGS